LIYGILLFNKSLMTIRTIYHEWSHLLQTYVGEEQYFKIIEQYEKIKDVQSKLLNKFNLTLDMVNQYFFNKKEYITHLDNLIYLIHQTQKLDKYKNLSDNQFLQLFKKTFGTSSINSLNTNLFKDIINIDKSFNIDILFYIASYILYKDTEFVNINFELSQRI